MSGQWWESNLIVGPFSNITEANAWAAANPSSLFLGLLATISGVPYSWSGSAWVSTSNVAPCYDTWDLAVAAAGSTRGWTGYVKRLCGNGYFHVMHNGTRLAVSPGESVISDAGPASAGYNLTATGTTYAALASYTIPEGLIGDGEEWMATICMKSGATLIGTDYPSVYLGGSAIAARALAETSKQSIAQGIILRLGGTMVRNHQSPTPTYASATLVDVNVNFDAPQTISAGCIPATVGNIVTMRIWVFGRAG